MSLKKIGKNYFMYFRDEHGKRHLLSTGTDVLADAELFHTGIMSAIKHRRSAMYFERFATPEMKEKAEEQRRFQPVISPRHQRGTLALSAMWDIAAKKHKLGEAHKYAWGPFLKNIGKNYADEITPQIALAYLEKFYGSGNGKSFNNTKSCLNTIFRCCLVEAGLSSSPFAVIVNKTVTNVNSHRNMTEDEFSRCFAAGNDNQKIMMMLSRWTAQRLETCARITPEMIDSKKKVFIIQPGKTKRFNEWVAVPIFPALEKFLAPYLKKCKDKKKPIVENFSYPGNNNFSWSFTQLIRKCKVKDTTKGSICFHSIRGSAITWMKENGIKGEDLRAITGHRSDAVEDIYARDIESMKQLAERFRNRA